MTTFVSQFVNTDTLEVTDSIDGDGDLNFWAAEEGGGFVSIYLRRPEVAALRDHLTAVLGDEVVTRESLYAENDRGREARAVVLRVAVRLGVALAEDVRDGNTWSPANMARVVEAIDAWMVAHESLSEMEVRGMSRAEALKAAEAAVERLAPARNSRGYMDSGVAPLKERTDAILRMANFLMGGEQ